MSNICLTQKEIVELTDASQKSLQMQWLSKEGFTFKISRRGFIKLSREHFQQMMSDKTGGRKNNFDVNLTALKKRTIHGQASKN